MPERHSELPTEPFVTPGASSSPLAGPAATRSVNCDTIEPLPKTIMSLPGCCFIASIARGSTLEDASCLTLLGPGFVHESTLRRFMR